jgi:hypothetical protein
MPPNHFGTARHARVTARGTGRDDVGFHRWFRRAFADDRPATPAVRHVRSATDAETALRHLTHLLSDPALLRPIPSSVAERGLLDLLDFGAGLTAALWDVRVDRATRFACIDAMAAAFGRVVGERRCPLACFEWWELVMLGRLAIAPPARRCPDLADHLRRSLTTLLRRHRGPGCRRGVRHGLQHLDAYRQRLIVKTIKSAPATLR